MSFAWDDSFNNIHAGFLMNNPALLRLIEKITGQPQLGEFDGRVYRMTNSAEHAFNWHSDAFDRRAVTMSVNLSPHIYDGGALQLKLRDSTEILQEIRNTGLGDALLFRISADLIHRVQGVTGDHPKIAFAGWFLQGEDLLAKLGQKAEPARSEYCESCKRSAGLGSPGFHEREYCLRPCCTMRGDRRFLNVFSCARPAFVSRLTADVRRIFQFRRRWSVVILPIAVALWLFYGRREARAGRLLRRILERGRWLRASQIEPGNAEIGTD